MQSYHLCIFRKDFPRNVRTDSVIVRTPSSDVRRLQSPGAPMSAGHYHPYRRLQSSLGLSSDHQDWLDNLQRLRERIASQIQVWVKIYFPPQKNIFRQIISKSPYFLKKNIEKSTRNVIFDVFFGLLKKPNFLKTPWHIWKNIHL